MKWAWSMRRLISEFSGKKKQSKKRSKEWKKVTVGASFEVQKVLGEYGSTPLKNGTTLAELIRRPELSYESSERLTKTDQVFPGMWQNRLILISNTTDISRDN